MTDFLRLVVAGCGRVFERFHLPAVSMSTNWQLVGASDPNPARRAWAQQVLPEALVFESMDQLLDRSKPSAVLIAAPPEQHVALVQKALGSGLHVLLEKPGGRSPDDANRISRFAFKTERLLWVGFNRRFKANYRELRGLVRSNPAVKSARFELAFSTTNWDPISGYLGKRDLGGDVTYDVASHQLDLLAWLFSSPIAEVHSRSWQRRRRAGEILSYDVRLENEITVECVAEHGVHYRDSMEIDLGTIRHLCYPTGLVREWRGTRQGLYRAARLRYWIDRKLIRIGLRRDPLQDSYLDQLEAFAVSIRGGAPDVSGSTVNELSNTHRGLQALYAGSTDARNWDAARREDARRERLS